ncbi:MAG: FHA domain-containing protein [Bdellovibrionota bacterium]
MKTFLKVSYVETFYEEFIELDSFPVDIGRDPKSKVVLMGHEISRKHAEIFEKEGEVFLKDTGSRTGIWHEGKQVKELKLTESLQLRIGPAILEFSFISFPLEQTLSFGHEEHQVHHEPIRKRVEDFLSGRMLSVLFFILLGLSYFTSPDFYRKGDFAKSIALALMGKVLLAPFLIALVVVIVRKLNRGDYAWARSLSLSYLLCIYIGVAELISSSFCWFKYFDLAWNSIFFSILMS